MRSPDRRRRNYRTAWILAIPLILLAWAAGVARAAEEPEAELRIAFGREADRGAFPSVVRVTNVRSATTASVCGGTIIDENWVLTAAHCVARADRRGPTDPGSMFVIAGTQVLSDGSGREIDVTQIVVHPAYGYAVGSPHDVALLRLASPTRLPRQLLASDAMRRGLEVPNAMAIVVGFGTMETGSLSPRLLRADVPVASREACRNAWGSPQALPAGAIGPATVCAGWAQPGMNDSCGGDSGGPLMLADRVGNRVQVGVVSWGQRGCGVARRPTVYASVGHHEAWIRQYAENARFSAPEPVPPAPVSVPASSVPPGYVPPAPRPAPPRPDTVPPEAAPLPPIGTPPPGLRPSDMPQLSLDIVQGNTLREGTQAHIRLTSSIAGHLVVFSIDAAGAVTQISPNRLSGQNGPGQVRNRLDAGGVTLLPGPADRFVMTVSRPLGRSRVVALVLPDAPGLQAAIGQHLDLRSIPDGLAYIQRLADLASAEASRSAQVVGRPDLVVPPNVAMADVWFTVVDR